VMIHKIFDNWEYFSLIVTFLAKLFFAWSLRPTLIFFFVFIKTQPLVDFRRVVLENRWGFPRNLFQRWFAGNMLSFASIWFGYMVHDEPLDGVNPPPGGGRLLVGYHSRPSVDLLYFMLTHHTATVVHDLLCDTPLIGDMLALLDVVPARAGHYDNKAVDRFVQRLIAQKGDRHSPTQQQPLLLLPGGAYECYKLLEERGKPVWHRDPGFAREVCRHRSRLTGLMIVPVYTRA
jgi:hypothetical protein